MPARTQARVELLDLVFGLVVTAIRANDVVSPGDLVLERQLRAKRWPASASVIPRSSRRFNCVSGVHVTTMT